MSTSELDFASTKTGPDAASDSKSALRLQRDMTRVAATAASRTELLAGLLDVATRHAAPLAAFFLERGSDGALGEPQWLGGAIGGGGTRAAAVSAASVSGTSVFGAGVSGGCVSGAAVSNVCVSGAVVSVAVGDDSTTHDAPSVNHLEPLPSIDRLSRQVASAARNACRAGEIEIRRHALPPLIAVAAPVPRRGLEPHACGAVFKPSESPAQLALLWQLFVAHVVLWEALHSAPTRSSNESVDNADAGEDRARADSVSAQADRAKVVGAGGGPMTGLSNSVSVPPTTTTGNELGRMPAIAPDDTAARDSDATIELMERALGAATMRQAAQTLCESLREHLGCERVLIGLRARDHSPCRLAAISQVARFDRRGESIRLMEAAMNESILRGGPALWPARDDGERHALLAHQTLAKSENAAAVLSFPLQSSGGSSIGVVTFTFAERAESGTAKADRGITSNAVVPVHLTEAASRFLAVAAPSLALVLDTVRQREGGAITRTWRMVRGALAGWRSVAVAGAFVAAIGLLATPWPYRVACECRVEPAVRRFVVAPYDGVLERVFVKPGEVVEHGQLLARLEDRALRLERPAIEAELHQATKKRDVALAKNDASARQIAELEIRQFASKLRLLDDRAEHLELTSPVKGVIASGDLERAEGATLEEGRSLFEIVLLDRMIVEIAVPDGEISHIRAGQAVDIRLDAYPGRGWEAPLERVQPRAEIRDEQNVFVAEIELDNADERLRPGMKGRAKIATPHRPLGWILFHKPWEFVVKRLAW